MRGNLCPDYEIFQAGFSGKLLIAFRSFMNGRKSREPHVHT